MREATQEPQGETITVSIGRFGQTPVEIVVPKDSTVQYALDQANISANGGNIFVAGQPARPENLLDEGDIVNVATSKQGG